MKHKATDSLLKILKVHGHTYLPATARTLLNTENVIATEIKSGTGNIYFDINNAILKNLMKYPPEYREYANR